MRKVRHQEVREPVQGHTVSEHWNHAMNPGSLTPEPTVLTWTLFFYMKEKTVQHITDTFMTHLARRIHEKVLQILFSLTYHCLFSTPCSRAVLVPHLSST